MRLSVRLQRTHLQDHGGRSDDCCRSMATSPQRVRMAAICSVCAEPFTNYMREYSTVPWPNGSSGRPPGRRGCRAPRSRMKYDALVVGSGISGMESALKLGDMGYKVLVGRKGAERRRQDDPAEQGLSHTGLRKLHLHAQDGCDDPPSQHRPCSRIRGGEHPQRRQRRIHAKIRQKPKFVDEAACTGCRQCEMACNVAVPDEYNSDMVSRRAAYIAFPQAVPKKAVIERAGRVSVHLQVPGRYKGARLRGSRAQWRVRQGLRTGARDHAARGQPRPCLLCALRGAMHARRAGGPAAHPSPQAIHRRHGDTPRRSLAPRKAGSHRQEGGHRRLRPGRA